MKKFRNNSSRLLTKHLLGFKENQDKHEVNTPSRPDTGVRAAAKEGRTQALRDTGTQVKASALLQNALQVP